jgi:hypothetical protein
MALKGLRVYYVVERGAIYFHRVHFPQGIYSVVERGAIYRGHDALLKMSCLKMLRYLPKLAPPPPARAIREEVLREGSVHEADLLRLQ